MPPKGDGKWSGEGAGHSFFRRYRVNLPSSFSLFRSSAIVFSTSPPVADWGTVTEGGPRSFLAGQDLLPLSFLAGGGIRGPAGIGHRRRLRVGRDLSVAKFSSRRSGRCGSERPAVSALSIRAQNPVDFGRSGFTDGGGSQGRPPHLSGHCVTHARRIVPKRHSWTDVQKRSSSFGRSATLHSQRKGRNVAGASADGWKVPLHCRGSFSVRPLRCYAFFQGWLLPSLPLGCSREGAPFLTGPS